MKKLDKKQRAKLDKLQKAIADEEPKLAAAVSEFNAAVKAAFAKLGGLIGGYTRAHVEFDRLVVPEDCLPPPGEGQRRFPGCPA
jgi:hypothetical protein